VGGDRGVHGSGGAWPRGGFRVPCPFPLRKGPEALACSAESPHRGRERAGESGELSGRNTSAQQIPPRHTC